MARNGKKIRIFSALEVANICGVVNQTAINWIKNGHLKAFITPGGQYRVYADDLIEFLNNRGMRIPEELEDLRAEKLSWRHILVVDDDKDLNDLLKRYLEKRYPDFTILQAYDGFEAGQIIAEWEPGVIILDINLPGIDGHKLCQKLKSDGQGQSPVIIAITGLDDPNEQKEMIENGADAFFSKPLELEQLNSAIKELISKYRGDDGERNETGRSHR
ncbi:MAG TPA: response regulator [Spirochaetia bacterium]|nr:response regulator [Spirochaetia bacterium]